MHLAAKGMEDTAEKPVIVQKTVKMSAVRFCLLRPHIRERIKVFREMVVSEDHRPIMTGLSIQNTIVVYNQYEYYYDFCNMVQRCCNPTTSATLCMK